MARSLSNLRIIDRFDEFTRLRGLTDSIVTREAGLAVGTLGKSRKPDKDLSRRTVEILLTTYPDISRSWLIDGVGDMTASPKAVSEGIPFIDDAAAECGRAGGLSQAVMAVDCRTISLPGVPKDTDFFIRATGYSMVNDDAPELSIPPGALVGVTKLRSQPFMRWGEVYVISTPDGVMIKRLLEDADPDYIRCASYNSANYPDFRIPAADIIECGRITCVVPIFLR